MIMAIEDAIFKRSELLLGSEAMQRLAAKKVIIFGVGGVGSWCAESLIRTGIRNLTIVDSDRVCESNINRQLMATTLTVGQVKVDALRERLLSINPSADIIRWQPESRQLASFPTKQCFARFVGFVTIPITSSNKHPSRVSRPPDPCAGR